MAEPPEVATSGSVGRIFESDLLIPMPESAEVPHRSGDRGYLLGPRQAEESALARMKA